MKLNKKKWALNALQVLVLVVVVLGIRTYMQRELVSGAAPPITGTLLDGSQFAAQQLQGKPALIYFWATWCPICRAEIGAINAVAADYPVLSVAMQSGADAEVAAYVAEEQVRFPVLNDPAGVWARRYGVQGVPASFIVNGDGEIEFVEVGYTTGWGLRWRLWWAGR